MRLASEAISYVVWPPVVICKSLTGHVGFIWYFYEGVGPAQPRGSSILSPPGMPQHADIPASTFHSEK